LIVTVLLTPAAQGCHHVAACDTGEVREIRASNYDQSCKVDSDCVAMGEGNVCYACIVECPTAAINVNAKGHYDSDISNEAPSSENAANCGCPASFAPCCLDGVCHADLQCEASQPPPDAATDASAE
jgi:hypothetical protein